MKQAERPLTPAEQAFVARGLPGNETRPLTADVRLAGDLCRAVLTVTAAGGTIAAAVAKAVAERQRAAAAEVERLLAGLPLSAELSALRRAKAGAESSRDA